MQSQNKSVFFKSSSTGFTLIELMAVCAVVAILAAIAYPSYEDSIRRARRAEGRAALMQLMQQQERFYSQHNSYIEFSSSSTGENQKRFKWFSSNTAAGSAYEIDAAACKDETIRDCVLLTATPGTTRVNSNFRDVACGKLMLASTGLKTVSGPATDCWK